MYAGAHTRVRERVSQDSNKPIGRFHGLRMGFFHLGCFSIFSSTASMIYRFRDVPAAVAASRHRSFVPLGVLIWMLSVFSSRYFMDAFFCASVYFDPILGYTSYLKYDTTYVYMLAIYILHNAVRKICPNLW